jgi:hypothetical protein
VKEFVGGKLVLLEKGALGQPKGGQFMETLRQIILPEIPAKWSMEKVESE